jgi:hypothetical protein
MKNKLLTVLAVALLAGPMAASAAFIGSYGTGSTGSVTGGTFSADQTVFDVNHVAYFQGATTPASNWVWTTDQSGFATINFTFSFDLTGYDLNTVSLSSVWGVDNIGSASLNGNLLSSLPNVVVGNFNVLTAFSTSQASYFNQGMNSLVFNVSNSGGVGAFRAAGEVSADLSPAPPAEIPAPASLLLVGLGIAGLGLRKQSKR